MWVFATFATHANLKFFQRALVGFGGASERDVAREAHGPADERDAQDFDLGDVLKGSGAERRQRQNVQVPACPTQKIYWIYLDIS